MDGACLVAGTVAGEGSFQGGVGKKADVLGKCCTLPVFLTYFAPI